MTSRFVTRIVRYPFLFFIFLTVVLSLDYVGLGAASYVRIGDNLDSFVLRFTVLSEQLRAGEIVYWNHLFAGGIDQLANDMVYWNIGTLLFTVLPPWLAYGFVLMVGVFCAGWFTFLLCERRLGCGRGASIVGGIIAASGLMKVDIMPYLLGFGVLPAALYYLERLLQKASFPQNDDRRCMERVRLMLGALGLGLVFAFFSSVPFTLPFTLVTIAVWFIIRRHPFVRSIILLAPFAFGAILPHVPVIHSLLVNAPLSNRGGGFYHVPWVYGLGIVRLLVRYYWVALLVMVVGLAMRLRTRLWIGLVLLIAAFLFIAPWYQPLATVFGHLFPRIRDFGFDRFYYLLPIVLGISSAITLHALDGELVVRGRNIALRSGAIALVVILILFDSLGTTVAHARGWLRDGSFYANTVSPDATPLSRPPLVRGGTGGLEPFRTATIADERTGLRPAFANMNGWETIDGDINIASRRFVDFWKELTSHTGPEPKHSFYFMWQATAADRARARADATVFMNPVLLSLANVQFLFSPFPIALPGFALIPTQFAEHYRDWSELSLREKVMARLIENSTKGGRRLLVYENQQVFPRAFFVKRVRVFDNAPALLKALGEVDAATLRYEAFVVKDEVGELPARFRVGSVTITDYRADAVTLSVSTTAPALLVVTNNYNPSWRAYADGVEARIIPVDRTFMGIVLEQPAATVTLRYEPPYNYVQTIRQ